MATQLEIEHSYDVGNDFFRLWLDESMNYSCGVWDGAASLEEAQDSKLALLSRFAHVGRETTVLDVGCGWGANLQYLSEHGVRSAHGITLSPSQRDEILRRELPGVTVDVVDYRKFAPVTPFQAAISICMFEHIATPEQALRGEHLSIFRNYFSLVHRWTAPGSWFGFQSIVVDKVPRRSDLRDIATATRKVLPGSKCARFEEIVRASSQKWELMTAVTRRTDYVRTCEEWLARLESSRSEIEVRWGSEVYQDYEHYLATCIRAFSERYLSLVQIAFRRND